MQLIMQLIDFILNIDKYIETIIGSYPLLTYFVLFGIIFIETGVVILPFLPGDSVLFAAGAIIAKTGLMNPVLVLVLLYIAAIAGDSLNYSIGTRLGKRVESKQKLKFIKMEYIERTRHFFDKHGHQAITIARFVPIIRTFAPFVAGVSKMKYAEFLKFNIIGGLLWVSIMYGAGFFFGNISFIKEHFSLIILAVIFISFVPVFIAFLKGLKKK
ncbi:MAG: VTT domain-containing protein [Bacilli bacterium]|nr:VTT domain-containing protein [Bacilli bacterium]